MFYFVRQKFMRWVSAIFLLLYTTQISAVAQEEDGPVSNVRPEKQGRVNVFIEYDLAGTVDDMYTVTLSIKLLSDSSYSYTPINVIGDIGPNIRPGKNKRISWRVSDEYIPAYDNEEDIQYIVNAVPLETDDSNTGLFIAGGAVIAGLTVAIVLLSSKKGDDRVNANVFPQPPGRP